MKTRAERRLALGDLIRDNDPRMPNRVLRIISFRADEDDSQKVDAICEQFDVRYKARQYSISIKRIHADSKQRRSMYDKGADAFALGDLKLPEQVWTAMIDAALT